MDQLRMRPLHALVFLVISHLTFPLLPSPSSPSNLMSRCHRSPHCCFLVPAGNQFIVGQIALNISKRAAARMELDPCGGKGVLESSITSFPID